MHILNAAIAIFVIAITAAIFGFTNFASGAIHAATILVAVFIVYTLFRLIKHKLTKRRL